MLLRHILLIFFILLSAGPCLCQNEWEKIDFGNERVNDCAFTNLNEGYVITDLGKLWKTTDGGESWNATQILTCQNCIFIPSKIFMFSATEGKILGQITNAQEKIDLIVNTTDGGATWDTIHSYTPYPVSGVDFKNPMRGFGRAMVQQSSNWDQRLHIMTAHDGGRKWEIANSFSQVSGGELAFKDTSIGLLGIFTQQPATRNTYRTTDGGNTWTRIFESAYYELSYTKAGVCYGCAGYPSTIDRSTDDGASWVEIGKLPCFEDVYFLNTLVGYYNINDPVENNNNYARTIDGGNSWEFGNIGDSADYVSKLIPVTEQKAFAISDKDLYITHTGGGFGSVVPPGSDLRISISNNPVFDYVFFSYSSLGENTILEIFDVVGRKVEEKIVETETTSFRLYVNNYLPGIYFARLGTKSIPFIKL